MDITTLGIDLAKSVFQLHGVDAQGVIVLQKKLRRGAVVKFLSNDLPPEAPSFITRVCGFGFHILRRQFEQARRVRSPQIAQALGALQRVFGCPEMSAV